MPKKLPNWSADLQSAHEAKSPGNAHETPNLPDPSSHRKLKTLHMAHRLSEIRIA